MKLLRAYQWYCHGRVTLWIKRRSWAMRRVNEKSFALLSGAKRSAAAGMGTAHSTVIDVTCSSRNLRPSLAERLGRLFGCRIPIPKKPRKVFQ